MEEYSKALACGLLMFRVLLGVEGESSLRDKPSCDFPAVYNFGDSNSDTGGISAAFWPASPPYGETFFKKPAGRASDGRLLIDFIAQQLNIPFLSAYLNSIERNFRQGANFATGGSTIREQIHESTLPVTWISPFHLGIQIVQFQQFQSRTSGLYNGTMTKPCEKSSLPRPRDFSKALYILDIGQNDLTIGFSRLSHEQLRAAIPDMVAHFSAAIENLYKQGAKSFWIHNTGPIGCLPESVRKVTDPPPGFLDPHGCIKYQNDMAIEFNKQLKDAVIKLRTRYQDTAITYVDLYAAKYKLISTSNDQGFVDPFQICCGDVEKNFTLGCSQKVLAANGSQLFGGSCKNPESYISWDSVHYTEAANHWVADHILNGSLSDPPIPITHSCYRC